MSARLAAALLLLGLGAAPPLAAQSAAPLSGQVRAAEGPLEGVLVSAKQDGGSITVTVVSDAKGHYEFPAGRLAPGHYTIDIRGGDYVLANPAAVDIGPAGAALDLAVKKAEDVAPLLSDAEWLASIPGTDAQKSFLTNCIDCHTLQRIVGSTHTADEFVQIFQRMSGYALGSSPLRPQLLVGGAEEPVPVGNPRVKATADYLASINLSAKPRWDYPLKLTPRATGKATRIVITEYDLPHPDSKPHDVIADQTGTVWYSDFGALTLGELDPKTGKVTEHAIPELRPGFPKGSFDLEQDADGNLWLALMYQGGLARFDKATQSVKTFPIPAEWQGNYTQQSMVSPTAAKVDGKVWTNDRGARAIYRLDVASGAYENLGQLKVPSTGRPIFTYGMPADSANNVYLLNYAGADVIRLDAKTKELSTFMTPTQNSKPRRGHVDDQDRLWFAEFAGNAIAMLDPKAGNIQEWKLPTAWSAPGDAVLDKSGDVWAATLLSDHIARLDPKTGEMIEYPLPRHSSLWRIFVEESGGKKRIWVGSDHGASIICLEPLD